MTNHTQSPSDDQDADKGSAIVVRRRGGFTHVDNSIINDQDLSMKALGMLVYMLSKPDDWTFYQGQIGAHFGEGRESMRSVMKNLEAAGYVFRHTTRNDRGQIITVTLVTDEKGVKPVTGLPPPVGLPPVNPSPIINTDLPITEEQKKNIKRAVPEVEEDFEILWKAYPHAKGRSDKKATLTAYRTLSKEDKILFRSAVTAFAAVQKDPQFSAAMERWIRKGLWRDFAKVESVGHDPQLTQTNYSRPAFPQEGTKPKDGLLL